MHASCTPTAVVVLSALSLSLACAKGADGGASGAAAAPRLAAARVAPPRLDEPYPVQVPAVWSASTPAVASDGQDFLAVYRVSDYARPVDAIFTARLHAAPGGALTADPPRPAPVGDSLSLGPPAIAWDGEAYVVVYTVYGVPARARALRLGRDGTPLGPELDLGPGAAGRIACGGGQCWVLVGLDVGLDVVRVDPLAWAVRSSVPLASRGYGAAIAIAGDGAGLAVAWGDDSRVLITRLDPGGAVLDAAPIEVASERLASAALAIAFSGGSYLVGWAAQEYPWIQELHARRVAADGTVLGAAPVRVARCDGGAWCAPVLSRDAAGWQAAWQDWDPASSRAFVLLARVGPDGVPGAPVEISDPLRRGALQPALAASGEAAVAVWTEIGDAWQIVAVPLGESGAAGPVVPLSFRAVDLPPEQRSPAIECQGYGLRAAWQERVGEESWVPAGLDLAPDARWASTEAPAVAGVQAPYPWGTTRLVAYAATDTGGLSHVQVGVTAQGATVTPSALADGPALREVTASAVDSSAFLVGWVDGGAEVPSIILQQYSLVPFNPWGPQLRLASGRSQASPVLGSDGGTGALAVWSEADASGASLRAQHLLAGPSLDAAGPQDLAAVSGAASRAAAAGSGRSWLVAWTEGSGGEAQVRARLLAADGVPSGEVLALGSGVVEGAPPAVTWDGAMYVVAWNAAVGPSIRGVGLDEAGGLLTDVFELAPHTSAPGPLGLCSPGSGRVMVVYPDLVPWNGLQIARLLQRSLTTWDPSALSVQIQPYGMGSVRSDVAGIDCGPRGGGCRLDAPPWTTLTLSAEPEPGWSFSGWQGACSGDGACAVDLSGGPVDVTATFEQLYFTLDVRLEGAGTGRVWSWSGIDCGMYGDVCSTRVASGTVVGLEAWAPPGSRFLGWTGPCREGEPTSPSCTVEMNEAALVTATFDDVRLLTVHSSGGYTQVTSAPAGIDCGDTCQAYFHTGTRVTLTPAPAPGWLFTGWATGSTSCQDPVACPPVLDLVEDTAIELSFEPGYPVSVDAWGTGEGSIISTPAGLECGGMTCEWLFRWGQRVRLDARAAPGSSFTGWTGACSGQGACEVTAPASASARFERGVDLAVVKEGEGTGRVVSDVPGIDCGERCAATFAPWQLVTLTATPDPGYTVAGFSPECAWISPTSCQIEAGAAPTVSVAFVPAATLRVTKTGSGAGLVKDVPGLLSCGESCSIVVAAGTPVQLRATPLSSADAFVGWTGPCEVLTTGECVVVVKDLTEVSARFERKPTTYPLSVTMSGSYGRVAVSTPSGATCTGGTCSWTYAAGATVTLTAGTTSTNAGFIGWSGACTGTSTRCVVSMTQARQVQATFAITRYNLTVQMNAGGRITSNAFTGSLAGPGSATFALPVGTSVRLTATAIPGGRFLGWSGVCSGSSAICTLTASKNQTAIAQFDPQLPELDVGVIGAGSGTVTSEPAGLTCSGYQVSCAQAFPLGTRITLTAVPAPGSYFERWSGWCSGSQPTCVIDQNSQHGTYAVFQPL